MFLMIKQIVVSINHQLPRFIIQEKKCFMARPRTQLAAVLQQIHKIFCSFIVFAVSEFFIRQKPIHFMSRGENICLPKKFAFMFEQKNWDMNGFFMWQNLGISPDWKVIDVEWEWRIFHRRAGNAAGMSSGLLELS